MSYVVKSLLELFHRPNFAVITNEEVRDWTDVEYIRNVTAWKRTQAPQPPEHHLNLQDSLGFGSCVSLMTDAGHQETNCQCNNEYIVVTNSRRARPSSARRARAFDFEHSQNTWQRDQLASHSMIDLSDVWESIRNVEPDYEIRSISSDDEFDIGTNTTPPQSQAESRASFSRQSTSRLGWSPESRSTFSRGTAASSAGSSRAQSRENTWNSHVASHVTQGHVTSHVTQGHRALSETASIARNRDISNKPDARKDFNNIF